MAGYPPKKNTAFIFYTSLVSQADTKLLKSGPTLAAGDFKVSIDGGAFNNLGTLPTNTPSGVALKISLSSSEMNGDNILVTCIDAAGAEWCDKSINIQTSVRQIDDLAYPATSGRSMVVDASGLVDSTTVKIGPTGSGTAQTARDLGASVLLSTGTGTGQLDFTSGVVKSNLSQILGTALTETAGLLAAGFKQFFNISSPTSTMNLLTAVTTLTTYTGNTPQTGDSFTRIGAAGAGLTALGDTRIANLDATVSSRTKPADTQAAVTLVTTTTNLTNAPTAGDFTATMKTSLSAATPAVTVSDKTGFALTAGEHTNIVSDVNTALDTAGSELSSIPSTTGTLRQKINFLFEYFRNKKTVTATTETLKKEDATTTLGTSTISDDGTTFTKGEMN